MLVPQMTEIHADDAAVVIHEPKRVEAEPRYGTPSSARKLSAPPPALTPGVSEYVSYEVHAGAVEEVGRRATLCG